MKEFHVTVNQIEINIIQDDDGKFVIPEYVKKLESFGTALKPAFEPITVARKPCEGSTTDNVLKYGVGGINIDECRIPTDDTLIHGGVLRTNSGDDRTGKSLGMFQDDTENTFVQNPNGRFPANVILTYDDSDFDEVCGGFPNTNHPNGSITNPNLKNTTGDSGIYSNWGNKPLLNAYQDCGSASRYFYCAKASKLDRDEGLELLKSNTQWFESVESIPNDVLYDIKTILGI